MIVPQQGSDQADEWLRLGMAAQQANNLPLAQQNYNQALRLDPRHALAMNNLAIVFAQSNLLNEALLTIERAAMCDGVHGVIQMNWALMAMDAERPDEAVDHAKRACEIAPDDPNAQLALAMIGPAAGLADETVELYRKILDKEPANPSAGPNICFVQTLTDATPAEMLAQRKKWYEANRFKGTIEPYRNDRNLDRPLRIGYVGGDFKSHSASFIFGRVVLHHSSACEVYLYSSLPVDPNADVMTKRFSEAAGPRWRDIATMNDEDAAALIRKDRIDILVDLAAHTNGGRLALFTRKPAPVQVTAWGFAHGTGLPEIDYFLADKVSVPEDERQHYAEKIIDLPCLLTMEEPAHYNLKATSHPPLRKNGYFTFGVYARYEKVSDKCLATFAEILRRVPDSKIEFKDNAFRRPYSCRRVMEIMQYKTICKSCRGIGCDNCERGVKGVMQCNSEFPINIAPERFLFSTATNHPDHMLAYQMADLILDPFPHCGGIVSLEAIYMGLPILTLYGNKPAGRNTSSVLTAMGRTEWIARTPEEYIEKAVDLAENGVRELAKARQSLRQELLESPVVKGYVEKVEEAYRQAWREWCEK
jgi:predicted O-linked N-acetylglucosamine transferase (SPINDLY family)